MKAIVEGHEKALERDMDTKAIINIDKTAYRVARQNKTKRLNEIKKVSDMETRLDSMEGQIDSINNSLNQIIELLSKK